ncbi:MAG: universal stress protein [Candidatus Zipacnadales bacterium]
MYSTVLVPLDTSELAEQALPHAIELARRFGAEVELLTVIPASLDNTLSPGITADEWDPRQLEAEEYLEAIAGRLAAEGITVRSEVRRGDVAEEIIDHATHCDLIVMCTHGRSGLGRWVYGSIADRTLRYATVPVLLVRAGADQA